MHQRGRPPNVIAPEADHKVSHESASISSTLESVVSPRRRATRPSTISLIRPHTATSQAIRPATPSRSRMLAMVKPARMSAAVARLKEIKSDNERFFVLT